MRKLIWALPFCILIAACSQDKNSKQQQIQVYLQQSDSLLQISKGEAKVYAQKAMELSVEIEDAGLQSYSLQKLANAVRFTGDLAILFNYDSTAVETARRAKDSVALCSALYAYARDLTTTSNLHKANSLLREEESVSNLLKDSIHKAKYLSALGSYHLKKQEVTEADSCFNESYKLAESINDKYLCALNKLSLFTTAIYSGIRDSSAKAVFEALDFFKRNNYPENVANCLYTLGDNYKYLGNNAKAIQYYTTANDMLLKHSNYFISASVQASVFQIALLQENLPLAKRAAISTEQSYKILNYPFGKGVATNFWGQYYSANNEFAKADSAFATADSIADNLDFAMLKTMNLVYKTQHLDRQGKARESDSIALLSYSALQKTGSKKLINNLNRTSDGKPGTDMEAKMFEDSNYLKKNGAAYLKALREQNDSNEVPIHKPLLSSFDSTIALAYNSQMQELDIQYRTRVKDDSLKLQTQQATIAKAESKNKNIIIAAATILLILVAAGLLLQSHYRRLAERDKAKIELLQNEIHHRVKNNLAVINRLVEVAGKNSVEDAPLATLKNRIKSIELLHNHLYSNEAKTGNISLQSYFEDLCLAIAATFQTAKDIQINIQAPTEVDSTIAEKLGLILNELVTNSFKYAFENKEAGSINVTAKTEGKNLTISVQDNGVGMPTEKSTKSYGMKLIKGLSNELNGKFSFQNMGGTSFQLSIPVTT